MARVLDTKVHVFNAMTPGRKARIPIIAPWRLCVFALSACKGRTLAGMILPAGTSPRFRCVPMRFMGFNGDE